MKKIVYVFLATILLAGCSDDSIENIDSIDSVDPVVSVLNKKGVAYSYNASSWSHRVHDLGGHWFYHWSNTPREELPENVEYVPMFWGKGSVNDENIVRLKQLKGAGKIKYILAFNEPDGENQSNMTVDEAIALWPKLEEIGLPLISPAVVGNGYTNDWLIEFMQKVEAKGLRVDYIAFHSYPGSSSTNFITRLKETYQAFNRPIWITEFAVADWNATTDEDNKYSKAEVLQFMKEVLPELDKIEWIYRYAWFDDSNASRPALASSRLFDENLNLTALGMFYAKHNPNTEIGLGVDTDYIPPVDEDELLVNGHFEGGTWEKTGWDTWQIPNEWDGYNSGIVDFDTTESYTGNYSARLKNGSSALQAVVDVEAGKTYTYKVFTKWAEDLGHSMKLVFKDDIANELIINSIDFPTTTEWSETIGEITIPAGVTKLRLVFWNEKDTHFYFDDISLKLKE